MPDSSHRSSSLPFSQKRRRPPWRSLVGALALALLAVGLGLFGYQRVTAEPTQQIEFIVEDGLPYGITQESVEAAAEGLALGYETFTMHVVERELTWDETYRGEIGDADVLLSVGSDSEDPDTVLEDFNRVSFRGEGSSQDGIGDARAVRAAFVNNQTLGHGPHAVIGAALTAADVKFDGANRSTVYWAAISALPMFGALLVMYFWARDRRVERQRAQRLSAAQLRLARVVLELDSLEVRFEVAQDALRADAETDSKQGFLARVFRVQDGTAADEHIASLRKQWWDVRSTSLELARHESRLESIFRDQAKLQAGETMEKALRGLEDFDELSRALKRQADAVADATELRAGHAGSRSVLDRIALPLIQALDEILSHRDQLPAAVEQLERNRADLLALSHQASSSQSLDTSEAPASDMTDAARLASDHTELLKRWDAVEQRIRDNTAEVITVLRRGLKTAGKAAITNRLLDEAASQRAKQRILTMTAGAVDSFQELRASLGLGRGTETGPLHAAERVLELLDMEKERPPEAKTEEAGQGAIALGTVLLPILVALGAGGWAASQVEIPATYGRELTGDQPLAGLNVYGDPELLPDQQEPQFEDDPTQVESLDLEYIRDTMQRSVEFNSESALLPAELNLAVAVVSADDYIDYRWQHPEFENRMDIDYWSLVEAQHQLKNDVAEEFPEVLDPDTGDIRVGQGILPVWILDQETYAVGYTMTGEISSGVESRLGRYTFQATEPTRINAQEDHFRLLGDVVAYDLHELGRAMEYNHMETANVEPKAIFWMTAVSVWTGLLTAMILGTAITESARRRVSDRDSRKQLESLSSQLHELALGLDMARLDLVAVLGGDRSASDGDAEQSEQRLYEAGLITAWREIEDLKTLPRKRQKGEAWKTRVASVHNLVEMLTTRSDDISTRAEALLRSQRSIG